MTHAEMDEFIRGELLKGFDLHKPEDAPVGIDAYVRFVTHDDRIGRTCITVSELEMRDARQREAIHYLLESRARNAMTSLQKLGQPGVEGARSR